MQDFWSEFVASLDRDTAPPLYDIFHFSDNPDHASQLAALVLCGDKRGTASLLWKYEHEGKRPPRVGDLSIVTDWDGKPLCVIETTGVDVHGFDQVPEEFAAAEGEGDRSLQYWRDVHWSFFGRECERLGRERTRTMPVVCQRFKVVIQPDTGAGRHLKNAT